MKRGLSPMFLLLVLALAIILAGCGGGGTSGPPPAITVSVSAAATAAETGGQITISAQVNNDSSNQGVTWSMTPAPGTGAGVLVNVSGMSVTYKAPGTPPASNVTVTVRRPAM